MEQRSLDHVGSLGERLNTRMESMFTRKFHAAVHLQELLGNGSCCRAPSRTDGVATSERALAHLPALLTMS